MELRSATTWKPRQRRARAAASHRGATQISRGIAARCGGDGEKRYLRALHAEEERRGHEEIEQAHDGRDLKGVEEAHQDDAGKDSAERGAGSFEQIGRAGSGARGEAELGSDHARGGDEQRA